MSSSGGRTRSTTAALLPLVPRPLHLLELPLPLPHPITFAGGSRRGGAANFCRCLLPIRSTTARAHVSGEVSHGGHAPAPAPAADTSPSISSASLDPAAAAASLLALPLFLRCMRRCASGTRCSAPVRHGGRRQAGSCPLCLFIVREDAVQQRRPRVDERVGLGRCWPPTWSARGRSTAAAGHGERPKEFTSIFL